jgi:hypothetical protein
MKPIVSFILCSPLLAPSQCLAGGNGSSQSSGRSGYFKKDPFTENRVSIYDNSGSPEGYTRKDPIRQDRWNVYDNKGRQKGYIEQDSLSRDRKNIFDRNGRKEGHLKKFLFRE